jgi:hypothetical protein
MRKTNAAMKNKSEKQIQHDIHTGLIGDTHLFRNNVGLAYTGDVKRHKNGTITITNARPIKFGLCPGSSDLIGWTTIEITPEMVGRRIAVFTAIEVKSATGRASDKQKKFIKRIHDCGGIAGVARSLDDAESIVNNYINEKK